MKYLGDGERTSIRLRHDGIDKVIVLNELRERTARKRTQGQIQDIPAETRYDNLLKAHRCFNCDMIPLNVKAMMAILEHLPAT